RINGGKLDLLANLLAEARRQGLDRLLHGIRAIDPLGRGRGELLRLLARGQRGPQLEPARFFAHLADSSINFAVDEIVDVAPAPLTPTRRWVVALANPRLRAPSRNLFDRRSKARLVARLACFVVSPRHSGRGLRHRHLRQDQRTSREAANRWP